MSSMLNVMLAKGTDTVALHSYKDIGMSGIEKRKQLHWRNASSRKVIGNWIDTRPMLEDSITLYREADKFFLEICFSDGCRSVDEVRVSDVADGTKLEDIGGNFFGEYFIIGQDNQLHFCNDKGAFYSAQQAA